MPPALVQSRPKSSLAHAWGLGYSGHYEELENHLRHAEAALTPEDTALRGEILALRAIAGALRGVGPQTTTAVAQEALTLVGTQDALACGMAHQALGHAYRMQGQPVEAEREYESALAVGPTSSKLTVLGALLRVAQVQVMRGQLQKGAHSFRQHLDIASAYGGQVRWYAGEALIRLGDLHREWNELDIALAQVQEGMALARRVENALALLNGYFTLLHVHAARGDFVAAQAALQQAEQYTVRYDFAHLDERLATHRAWLAMISDHPDEATRWAETYAVQRQLPRETVADFQEILLARVWLHQKRLAEAQEVLCALRPAAEATGRGWTVLQTLVLQAVIAQKQGDRPQAHALLTKALTTAEPEGYVRLFIEEGAPMQTLLSEQAHTLTTANGKAHERLSAYRHLLLAAFGSHRPAVAANQPLIIEPLSAREQEVLRLMAAGASNQGIAATLVISIGTVKSHINRILGKLGVRNRTQAVVRGQALKLV